MSVQTYKIVNVSDDVRPWDSKYGPMVSYKVQVHGDGRTFELAQKKDTAPPQVGQELLATVEEREFNGSTFYKLKKVQQQQQGRPEDPERSRRILRQHSQHMSLLALQLKYPTGLPPDMDLWATVKAGADWFDKDVE